MTNLNKQFEELRAEMSQARMAADPAEVRQAFLGRKGKLTQLLRQIGELPTEQRAAAGAMANQLRVELEQQLAKIQPKGNAQQPTIDMSVPAGPLPSGGIHPVSAMIKEMTAIFRDLSFEVVEGPEIVQEEENFETLNIGKDHPARDPQDSFFIQDDWLLRTQTTAVQVLEMRARQKRDDFPIRIVVPGKTYRRESDQTHSPMFHQIDAVVVDQQTTFSDLRGSLAYLAQRLFGDTVETRFRPHHFPFTEPSAEMDIRFKGQAQQDGKHTQWLEMGGCGMIHPKVLEQAGVNPKVYQGWAFGMSIERPLMVRHQIPDLRLLFGNSTHFLKQTSSRV